MFSSLKIKALLGMYVFIIISIPVGAYFLSQQTTFKSSASEKKTAAKITSSPKPITSPAKELQAQSENLVNFSAPSPTPESESTLATSFGPTLKLKVNFEGRPKGNQKDRLFVGIVEGSVSLNPKFLLSFTIDLPATGEYSNISLAGLNPGTSYSALLKGPAQIASASAFIMSPTVSNLNSSEAIILLTGDLNEDNTINSADYSIIQKALGSTPSKINWNENADFNRDGIINSFDLAFIIKNFGKIGDSGTWISPLPTATPSASLNTGPPTGGPSNQGYWIFVPAQ